MPGWLIFLSLPSEDFLELEPPYTGSWKQLNGLPQPMPFFIRFADFGFFVGLPQRAPEPFAVFFEPYVMLASNREGAGNRQGGPASRSYSVLAHAVPDSCTTNSVQVQHLRDHVDGGVQKADAPCTAQHEHGREQGVEDRYPSPVAPTISWLCQNALGHLRFT